MSLPPAKPNVRKRPTKAPAPAPAPAPPPSVAPAEEEVFDPARVKQEPAPPTAETEARFSCVPPDPVVYVLMSPAQAMDLALLSAFTAIVLWKGIEGLECLAKSLLDRFLDRQ
jgi:hypothetical protein